MVGGEKSCQVSFPSFAAFRNEQEEEAAHQMAQVTQQSRLSVYVHCFTAHLAAFLKDRPLWTSTCEFRGGRKHVRGGEKEEKMKALGFLSRSAASAKTCQASAEE